MNEPDLSHLIAWKQSRSGAWAGGGFHYQHLVATLILIRQWAGLAPSGYLVPEGLEDCVIELPNRQVWLQIKSRKDAKFSKTEVQSVFSSIDSKATKLKSEFPTSSIVVLNQECSGAAAEDMEYLFDDVPKKIILSNSPKEEIVTLLAKSLETAVIIAEGIANDLYQLVADASSDNASVSYDKRKRISTTDVERRILLRLEAEDPSAINKAMSSGAIEPVDFQTPVDDPGFYLGVKAVPGHIPAGLIFPRPDEVNEITTKLRNRRFVLISGPSGAGKSALMWLSANVLSQEFRWFQITAKAVGNDADSIVRFVRARRPSPTSRIGLVVDDINSANSTLWDVLLDLLRGLPEVFIFGSVRTENIHLITNQSDTEFFQVNLDEQLAQRVWNKLDKEGHTSWPHWREPFEQSEGLMLEYTHILTQGNRLAAVISDQIRQREHKHRVEELAIIRCTAELCGHGGEVEARQLFKLLDIPPDRASEALKRLIDEHLVHESRPGILGGLHLLRSIALSDASHDGVVYKRTDSLWTGFLAVTDDTLPRIIQSVLAESQGKYDEQMLRKIAELLESTNDVQKWSAILTGLGLATMERLVTLFISILEQQGIQRAHWSLASMFFDPSTNVPNISGQEQLQALTEAVETFRGVTKADLRTTCLGYLPKGTTVPPCNSFEEANRLLSSIVPIGDEGNTVPINISPEFTGGSEQKIQDVATLLSTAFLVAPNLAKEFVHAFGGEEVLFDWFRNQMPWVTTPVIDPDEKHGRTVRADLYLVAEEYQGDIHETVVKICETLTAISPTSDAAASDAIDPTGRLIKIGDYAPASKNMPRESLLSKPRVAWNVAFRQIVSARASEDSMSKYAQHMIELITETEKLFRSITEKWISSKKIGNANALATSINKVVNAVNSLAYTEPQLVATSMTTITKGSATDDTLGALLTGVLGNLVPRMSKLPSDGGIKGVAVFAGRLAGQARDHQQSEIWRTTSKPPIKKLNALGERLDDVSCILHEMANDDSLTAIQGLFNASKKAPLGKSVPFTARRCRMRSEIRLQKKLYTLEKNMEKRGCHVQCRTRSLEEADSVYWPPVEIALLVDMASFETSITYLDDCISVAQELLRQDWLFRVVPLMNGNVLASFAINPSSSLLSSQELRLPDVDFAKDWQEHIDLPFHFSEALEKFEKAMSACMQLSGIVNCRNLEEMNPEEQEITKKIIDNFESNRERLEEIAAGTGLEELDWFLNKVNSAWNQLVEENESVRDGKNVSSPLYEGIYSHFTGKESDWLIELAVARMLLVQAEISSKISNADGC